MTELQPEKEPASEAEHEDDEVTGDAGPADAAEVTNENVPRDNDPNPPIDIPF